MPSKVQVNIRSEGDVTLTLKKNDQGTQWLPVK